MRPNNRTGSAMLAFAVAIIATLISTVSPAAAQTAAVGAQSIESALVPGSTVWITDAEAQEQKVRILDVTGGSVTALADGTTRHFRTDDITRVRARRQDSVLNGALIGAGAAVASGLFMCRAMEPWETCNNAGPLLKFGAVGAGIGVGVDALIRGRKTIYERGSRSMRVHAIPIVDREMRGIQFTVTF